MNESEEKPSLNDQATRISCRLINEIFEMAQGYDIKLNPKAYLIEQVKKHLEAWL